jgi:hypothetical protein
MTFRMNHLKIVMQDIFFCHIEKKGNTNTLCWTLKDHTFENSSMVWVCRLSFPLGTRKLNLVSCLFDKPFFSEGNVMRKGNFACFSN